MTTGVVIPWREGNGLLRVRAANAVRAHLTGSGFHVCLADCGEPWSPGRARNAGAALQPEWDPLLVVDADTIVPWPQLYNAVHLAAAEPGLVYGYTVYVRCNRDGEDTGEVFEGSASFGCAAISRACFDELGGFDESFLGWGYEDLDLARRAGERWPLRRVDGLARHLWHGERRADGSPVDADAGLAASNLRRWLNAAPAPV